PLVPERLLQEETRRDLVQDERILADELEPLRVAREELGAERDAHPRARPQRSPDDHLHLLGRRQVDLRGERGGDEDQPGELVLRLERQRHARPRAPAAADEEDRQARVLVAGQVDELAYVADELLAVL